MKLRKQHQPSLFEVNFICCIFKGNSVNTGDRSDPPSHGTSGERPRLGLGLRARGRGAVQGPCQRERGVAEAYCAGKMLKPISYT